MDAQELNNKFSQWNPMENDYKNTEFNQYISGPGADLAEELQPAQQALQKSADNKTQAVPTLVFKYLPQGMTRMAMQHMCSKYGAVRQVRDSTKNDYYFVDMATVADMEAVLRALENNNYGFKIEVGKGKSNTPRNQNLQSVSNVPPNSTGIDYESRNYRTSKISHPRPKIEEDTLLNAGDVTNTGLPLNLLSNDAHSLERQGIYKMQNNNKFNYRHGRSIVSIPIKTKHFIDKKNKESSGTYNTTEDKYLHTVEKSQMNKIAKCSQCDYACDTVCERCNQYYCSVECQQRDWQDHRHICGKPKHLQKIPSSKQDIQCDNNSKITKKNNEKSTVTETKTAQEVAISPISPEMLLRSSKRVPKQLQCINVDAFKQPSPKNPEEPSNSLKTQLQNSGTSSKNSSKKLPAALKASFKQLSNSTVESSQQLPTSTDKPQQFTNSSIASQSNSNNNFKNANEIYKQNMPRSGNIVTITSISKTNIVFIRSKTYDDNFSYFNTVDTLQSLGKNLHPLKNLPKSGDVVIAKFGEQFNRALVLNTFDATKILINFMDYGNMEQTNLENLFEAPTELIYKPRHAIPVLLKDVDNFYMTQEVRKFMYTYLNNINVEIRYKPEDFQKDNNVFAVELIDENTQQNLNKTIMKLSKPVEPQNIDEICDKDYLEKKILPTGKNLELIVMDNSLMCSACISCTTKPYAIEIEKFKIDIQKYVKSIPKEAYTPRVHELCIAQYAEDGLWYRGLCMEIVGDGHPSIHFIDYGNITMIPIENIRRYPRQFTYPIYTIDCTIEGLPEFCDDELVAELEQLLPNGELIKCENIAIDEECNFYTLSMPHVIKALQQA